MKQNAKSFIEVTLFVQPDEVRFELGLVKRRLRDAADYLQL